MPSLRKPLSVRQKMIAFYTDPNVYALADVVATDILGAGPTHPDHRRHVTCFLLDMEARLHTNRQQLERNQADQRDLHSLRCELALKTTGRDVLLGHPLSPDVVRKWRYRFLPTADDVAKAKKEGRRVVDVEARLCAFVTAYELLAMARATELGQFPAGEERNLAKLHKRHMCCADGTYMRAHSTVLQLPDLETGDMLTLGSRAKKNQDGVPGKPRVQKNVHRAPKGDRETMGVNHVAVLTRTKFGRVILTVEQAFGGEVHSALRAMERIAPLAGGGIWGLAYDKAMEGWQRDYLLARTGIVPISPPKAARGKLPQVSAADTVVDTFLAVLDAAQTAADAETHRRTGKKPKKTPPVGKAVREALFSKHLRRHFDIEKMHADLQAKRALGSGLPLGTAAYLDSNGKVVAVHSQAQYFDTIKSHVVGPEKCEHELHVDDGGLWDTRLELGRLVKDQRLEPVHAEAVKDERTGCYQLHTTYQFVCEYTGEILTRKVTFAPSGEWHAKEDGKQYKRRTARQEMMLLAPCDRRWRKIYGLRGDCESWFSWLKQQLLDDKRAPSLDLNHQLLDVLYAGVLTNAITLFHARRDGRI